MADDPDLVARRDGDDPEEALPTGDCAELLEQLAAASVVAEAEDLTRGVR